MECWLPAPDNLHQLRLLQLSPEAEIRAVSYLGAKVEAVWSEMVQPVEGFLKGNLYTLVLVRCVESFLQRTRQKRAQALKNIFCPQAAAAEADLKPLRGQGLVECALKPSKSSEQSG